MEKKRLILMGLVLFLVLTAVARLDQGRNQQNLQQLEQALRRTAVACYAAEGAYPPNVDYMKAHYGLLYDDSRYLVHYRLTASNFMPEITVIERSP